MIVDAEQIYEPLFKRETNQFQNNSLSQKVSVNFADRLLCTSHKGIQFETFSFVDN